MAAARRCAACSKFLPKPSGRGRPALSCVSCLIKRKAIRTVACRDCSVALPAPVGRGRPAVKCSACRPVRVLVNA